MVPSSLMTSSSLLSEEACMLRNFQPALENLMLHESSHILSASRVLDVDRTWRIAIGLP